MKFFITLLVAGLLLVIGATPCFPWTLIFQWDYEDPPPDLAGFKLYQREQAQSYPATPITTFPPAGGLALSGTYILTGPDNYYFWVLTAYDTSGNESGYSNEATAYVGNRVPGRAILSKNRTIRINICPPKTTASNTLHHSNSVAKNYLNTLD